MLQAPHPYWNMKQYKSVEFCQFLQCQAPLYKRKAPLLKTFWRRFCADIEHSMCVKVKNAAKPYNEKAAKGNENSASEYKAKQVH